MTSVGTPDLELDRFETTLEGDTIVGYGTTDALVGPLAAQLGGPTTVMVTMATPVKPSPSVATKRTS